MATGYENHPKKSSYSEQKSNINCLDSSITPMRQIPEEFAKLTSEVHIGRTLIIDIIERLSSVLLSNPTNPEGCEVAVGLDSSMGRDLNSLREQVEYNNQTLRNILQCLAL